MRGRPPKEENPTLSFSAHQWYLALNLHPDTFARKMAEAGVKYEVHGLISALDVHRAMNNEKDRAIARKNTADAISKEISNSEKLGTLFNLPACEKILWNDLLGPLRQEIEQMPQLCSALCNPQDPPTAQKVLEQWKERVKQTLKG